MTKWKLVPVEPTPEMIDAWNNDDSDDFRHAYKAMLEAAPQPQKLSDERILCHLDAILKASGSGLKNYSMHKTIEGMKQAVRAIEREILGENNDSN